MTVIKDFVVSLLIIYAFLVVMSTLDDSYEDAQLSAQVLDECIAQANAEQQITNRVASIYQGKAVNN